MGRNCANVRPREHHRGLGTPALVGASMDRPERTSRNWAAKGLIPSMRDPKTGELLVESLAAKASVEDDKVWWDKKRAELT